MLAFLYLVTLLATIVVVPFAALLAIRHMAENNFIFMQVAERTAKARVASQSGGLVGMELQYKEHHIHSTIEGLEEQPRSGNIVADDEVPEWSPGFYKRNSSLIDTLGLTGIRYLGIPGMHETYQHEYMESHLQPATDSDSPDQVKIVVVRGKRDFLPLKKDVYYLPLHKVETHEKVTLNIGLLLTAFPVNPEHALFNVDRWLEAISTQMMSTFRRLVGALNWDAVQSALGHDLFPSEDLEGEELRKFAEGVEKAIFDTLSDERKEQRQKEIHRAIDALHDLMGKIEVDYGIRIEMLQVGPIDPAGERARELMEAGSKAYEAEMEARRIALVYGEIGKHGDLGRLVQTMDALRDIAKDPAAKIIPLPMDLMTFMTGGTAPSSSDDTTTGRPDRPSGSDGVRGVLSRFIGRRR